MTIQECKDFGWEAITKTEEVIIPNSDGSVRELIPVEVTDSAKYSGIYVVFAYNSQSESWTLVRR